MEDPHGKDYSILGSILGSPCFGEIRYTVVYREISGFGRGYTGFLAMVIVE